jgi:hypothetical protein
MKKNDKRILSSLLFFAILTGIIMFIFLFFYTIPNETINFKNLSTAEYMNIVYLNNHPKFNYFNGLWLMFSGLFWLCIVCLLDLPVHTNNAVELIKTRFKRKK